MFLLSFMFVLCANIRVCFCIRGVHLCSQRSCVLWAVFCVIVTFTSTHECVSLCVSMFVSVRVCLCMYACVSMCIYRNLYI